jgi:hypothetical protein
VSPIFVRPVREQLEHDRLIRFLANKYKKKFEVAANPGDEQTAPLKIGQNTFFPDLVLTANRKLAGVVEVESGESVNNLEAMAQWVQFSRLRAPFHLYVPVTAFDVARRLCEANQVRAAEIWTYRALTDGFDLVRGFHDPAAAHAVPQQKTPVNGTTKAPRKSKAVTKPKPVKRPAAKKASKPAKAKATKRPAASAKPRKPSKPTRKKR